MKHSHLVGELCAGVFGFIALLPHAQAAPQCTEKDISEYAYLTKDELIDEYCKQSVESARHYAQAVSYREASFNARDDGVRKLAQMMLESSLPYTESGRCSSENTHKAMRALRKGHGIEAKDFACEMDH